MISLSPLSAQEDLPEATAERDPAQSSPTADEPPRPPPEEETRTEAENAEEAPGDEAAAIAFAEIESLFPLADRMTPRDYSTLIFGPLNRFLRTFPDDPRAEDVRKFILVAEEERRLADTGSRKVAGVWLSPLEYRARRPEFEAEDALGRLRSMARSADPIAAMNAFDDFEREHAGTAAYADAVPVALGILPRLSGKIARTRREQPAILRQRMEEIRAASNRVEMHQAFQRENAIIESQREAARQAGQKWIPPHPIYSETLEETEILAAAEQARLQSFRREEHLQLLSNIQTARERMESGDIAGAYAVFQSISPPGYIESTVEELERQLILAAGAEGIDLVSTPAQAPSEPASSGEPAPPTGARRALPFAALGALLAVFAGIILLVVVLRFRGRSSG
ncbi:MAG TPA: hypothetical protein VMN36_09325 [Verrucomicrobiales bacterium]|nr:hypothetical protein [Verrucomicrobiales bacterium]